MKKMRIVLFLAVLTVILGGCGTTTSNPVVRAITSKPGTDKKEYSIVYDNSQIEATSEFTPDETIILYADNDDFSANVENGKVNVRLDDTKLTDDTGDPYDTDDVIRSLMQDIADNAEHDIFDVSIIIDDDRYFVFEKHNVNIQTPCVLYEYDTTAKVLNELCRWEDVDLIGISVYGSDSDVSTTIIGGADGPTSIYLASKTASDDKKEQDINDSEYTAVIDRVLNEYNFEPVDWNNTIEWSEDADVLIKMAEENKGRYKAYGIISKEAGPYGIVLIDTVDWTELNTNYVYEKWFYTGSSDGEPELKWDKSRLYFTYPVPSIIGYRMKTVMIDCGYDTGHMEFVE
ncbi:MAG: hypothetical protein IJI23_12005 [Lachnospiraceae bacterium]|nr:hypothetical protein [Lachnospiraceae bacterium]